MAICSIHQYDPLEMTEEPKRANRHTEVAVTVMIKVHQLGHLKIGKADPMLKISVPPVEILETVLLGRPAIELIDLWTETGSDLLLIPCVMPPDFLEARVAKVIKITDVLIKTRTMDGSTQCLVVLTFHLVRGEEDEEPPVEATANNLCLVDQIAGLDI